MADAQPPPSPSIDLDLARRVLETEAAAIQGLIAGVDERFANAVQLLFECAGRVIVTGMGKSGIICRKIAATLASTGTPAFFLHPAEAVHGDLGVIRGPDVVVAVSYSGETAELLRVLETIRRLGARLITITGTPGSTLALAADVSLDCQVRTEACPLNLVPTASTTATLAMGDALAMTLLVRKGFREEDFANLHPGGTLGKRLMRVEHLMQTGERIPCVAPDATMPDVVNEISSQGLGMTCVGRPDRRLLGVITDGDLRRHLSTTSRLMELTAQDVMTTDPIVVNRSRLAVEAIRLMEERRITALVVVGADQTIEGVVHLHALWRTDMF